MGYSVLNEYKISNYIEASRVVATILSKSGKIYMGVCIDTSSTLGICAKHNVIINMITNSDIEIGKVLTIMLVV